MDNRKIEDQIYKVRKEILYIDHFVEEAIDEVIVLDEEINQMFLILGSEIDSKKVRPITEYVSEIYRDIKVEDKKIYDLDEEVKNLSLKLDKIPKLLEKESEKYWTGFTQAIINTEGNHNIINKLCQYTHNFQDSLIQFKNTMDFYEPAFNELKKEYTRLNASLKD
jgi:hypothetical protein